jgi:hypothetical protein
MRVDGVIEGPPSCTDRRRSARNNAFRLPTIMGTHQRVKLSVFLKPLLAYAANLEPICTAV